VIKGDAKRPATLCTNEKTYSITKVETSNTVVLMEGASLEGAVECYYEITETIPRDLDQLYTLLSRAYYPQEKKKTSEKEREQKFYSTEDLVQFVQASEREIRDSLRELEAFEVNGQWRVAEPSYADEIIELIMLLIVEKGWKQIPREECEEELKNYDATVVNHILRTLSSECNDSTYKLDLNKIAIARAKSLFRINTKWKLSDFKTTWEQSLSSLEYTPDVSLLLNYPLCFLEDSNVRYIDKNILSYDIKQRFKQLFQIKAKWKRNELEPFIKNLIRGNLDSTLDLFCKLIQSVTGGESYYVSK